MVEGRMGLVKALFPLLCAASQAAAISFPLPGDPDEGVVGELKTVTALNEDTLIDIAREADLGYDEMMKANPKVNRWVPGAGARVLLPAEYVLPDAPREGIVLNLPELRLYYYPPAKRGAPRRVETFPVSIGRMDWKTPLGRTRVVKKVKNPAWYPTPAVRKEHAADGDVLPAFIPGGSPDNPLGHYALRLGLPEYLIHGTDERKAYGIGMRVTHGCVRMYPEDIQQLFNQVAAGAPVRIVDQPIKTGRRGSSIFLEVSAPFEEGHEAHSAISYELALDVLRRRWKGRIDLEPDLVQEAVRRGDDVPVIVGQIPDVRGVLYNR